MTPKPMLGICFLVVALSLQKPAFADGFGIVANGNADFTLPTTCLTGCFTNNWQGSIAAVGGNNNQMTVYQPQPVSGNATIVFTDPQYYYPNPSPIFTDTASAGVTLSVNNGSLHDWTWASAANADPNPEAVARADANGDVIWLDTFTVAGNAPKGTPVTIQFTGHLDGTYQFSGAAANELYFDNAVGSLFFTNTYSNSPNCVASNGCTLWDTPTTQSGLVDITQTGTFQSFIGQTFSLEEELSMLTEGGVAGAGGVSSSMNFSNTAYDNLDVLTPGAYLITASGVDYSTPTTAVPEPSSLLLLGTGVVAGIGMIKRKARANRRSTAIDAALRLDPSRPLSSGAVATTP